MDAKPKTYEEPDTDNDDRMSRKEVALRLGTSRRSVQRMDETGELHPIFDAERKRVWYDRAEVEAVAAKKQAEEAEPTTADSAGRTSGDVAALVYTALRAGKWSDDIVIEHGLHPEVVDPLVDAYLRQHEHIMLQDGVLVELRRMIGPVRTAEDIVGRVKTLLEFFLAGWKAFGANASIDGLVERLNSLVAMYRELQQLFGPVASVEELRGIAQRYIAAAEELKRFSRPCPRCGQWYQATADRDWAALVEGELLEDQFCGECTAKEVTADMIERGRAAKAKKSDDGQ